MALSPIGKNMALTLIRLQVLKLQQCICVDVEFPEASIPKLAIMRHDELEENLRRVIRERTNARLVIRNTGQMSTHKSNLESHWVQESFVHLTLCVRRCRSPATTSTNAFGLK